MCGLKRSGERKSGTVQQSFDGFGLQELVGNLFFAVKPDAAAMAQIDAVTRSLRAEHGLRGRVIDEDRLHVTLQYLGQFAGLPANVLAAARHAGEALTMDAFQLTFDSVASFGSGRDRRPLVLRGQGAAVAAVVALHDALATRLASAGLKPDTRHEFVPHLTVLYDEHAIAPRSIEPVGWRVREFHLLRSFVGASRYETLASWTLRE
jgi:2'-5' RNA ligase